MNTHPLMLGIVGDSATGRVTLTSGIVRVLGRKGVTPLCLDDYHRYSRSERAAQGLTPLDPTTNNLELMTRHLSLLRRGENITKPIYDHRSGAMRGPELVRATSLVIAYGLLPLSTPELAGLFDFTAYLDPAPDLQRHWKIQRDVARRGYTPEQVLAEREARERDAARYLKPQRQSADMVVRFFPPPGVAAAQADPHHLSVEVTLRHRPGQVTLLTSLTKLGQKSPASSKYVEVQTDFVDEDGRTSDRLVYHSTSARWFEHPQLDMLGNFPSEHGLIHSDSLALVQLLMIQVLEQIRRNPF
ncbi:MAG: phosphoribulokinase [Chloroflexales bacterium]|nr:phosphoribulokinase [Chloroflexales bacterium]